MFVGPSALTNRAHPRSTTPKPEASSPLFQAALAAAERRGDRPADGVCVDSVIAASLEDKDASMFPVFMLA